MNLSLQTTGSIIPGMGKKRKGYYQYFSSKTGRIVKRGTRDAKRRHIRYAKSIEKSRVKRKSKSTPKPRAIKARYAGIKPVGFGRYKRAIYEIPFEYTSRGLEISQEALLDALLREVKKNEDAIVHAYVNVEFKDRVEGRLETEDVWYPASQTLLASEPSTLGILIRSITQAILGSNKGRLLELNLQFEVE